jgi:outer membrane protein assembly factor BamE
MRHFLISALLLSLLAGCSGYRFGPHRIDVQQGNALDQENVARLKLGLSHSQVRFLLGTPLLVDPFHSDRWDYVYVYYKAGKLAEQRHISLFFDGDTLVRIEGDMPAVEPAAQASAPTPADKSEPQAGAQVAPAVAEASQNPAPQAEPAVATSAKPAPAVAAGAQENKVAQAAAPATEPAAAPVASPDAAPAAAAKKSPASPKRKSVSAATSIVQPLPSPKDAPPYKDPHTAPEMSLQPATDVEQIKPDVIPPFPESTPVAAAVNEDAVLKALNAWASAWSQRDAEAYFAAYDPGFSPQGGGTRADWVKRRRMLLEVAKNIEVKIESPSVDRVDEGTVTVTFNQFYRSEKYHDAVVKQLRMTERDGRWLIVDEKVLSVLHGAKP